MVVKKVADNAVDLIDIVLVKNDDDKDIVLSLLLILSLMVKMKMSALL